MGPPPPAPLPEEIVEEILLRVPPSDPASLARAAVAQKRWCHLVTGDEFRRRYRALHPTPPTLGFFCDPRGADGERVSTGFIPASSFRPKPRGAGDLREYRPEDVRHGRVLLRFSPAFSSGIAKPKFGLAVWNPITGHRVVLPRPKFLCNEWWSWRATLLCAAPAGSCDHLDCHRGHFIVVLIGNYTNSGMLSCVYSSQTGAWSNTVLAHHIGGFYHLCEYSGNCAHVGNALYHMLHRGNKILKYDLGTREFFVMEPPPLLSPEAYTLSERIELTTMEDGQLGLAVQRQSTLYILSTDEEFGWGQTKIIDLEKCGNYASPTMRPSLIGFAGDIGLVFMKTEINGILSVNIRYDQIKVVHRITSISWIVPYINFCTPAVGVLANDDKAKSGASRDV